MALRMPKAGVQFSEVLGAGESAHGKKPVDRAKWFRTSFPPDHSWHRPLFCRTHPQALFPGTRLGGYPGNCFLSRLRMDSAVPAPAGTGKRGMLRAPDGGHHSSRHVAVLSDGERVCKGIQVSGKRDWQ